MDIMDNIHNAEKLAVRGEFDNGHSVILSFCHSIAAFHEAASGNSESETEVTNSKSLGFPFCFLKGCGRKHLNSGLKSFRRNNINCYDTITNDSCLFF